MSKPLDYSQIITDGGFYPLSDVAFLRRDRKNPGMTSFLHINSKIWDGWLNADDLNMTDAPGALLAVIGQMQQSAASLRQMRLCVETR